jgi:hypothetical protein
MTDIESFCFLEIWIILFFKYPGASTIFAQFSLLENSVTDAFRHNKIYKRAFRVNLAQNESYKEIGVVIFVFFFFSLIICMITTFLALIGCF